MNATVVSNCEKKFVHKALEDYVRLDGRAFEEFREVSIEFGKDWGCCCVSLGKTKVLAQTSCEVQVPKSSRPSEGMLNINLELNPLAAPNFEAGRQSEQSVQLNRLLEKCIKDSKAVDLESLCIKTNEKESIFAIWENITRMAECLMDTSMVWAFRVDLNVLNHEGNILDCASIAMLASLAHFRRPDVTCDGEEFTIHSYKKRDPLPTVIHHYPVCVTFAIFCAGKFILSDPNLLEEGVADAFLTLGVNSFRELCGLHLGGKAELTPDVILKTTKRAASRAIVVVEQIKEAVAANTELRSTQKVGFHKHISDQNVEKPNLESLLDHWTEQSLTSKRSKKKWQKKKIEAGELRILEENTAAFIPKEDESVTVPMEADEDEIEVSSDDGDSVVYVEPRKVEPIEIDDENSEEEEDVEILPGNEST